MPGQVLAVAPDGSARHSDIHMFPRRAAANGLTSAATDRAGAGALLIGASSNWGLGGTDNGTLIESLGAPVWQIRGGIVCHEWRIPLVRTRPANIEVWRDALYVIEVVLKWPANAVGADNGLLWGWQDNVSSLRPSVAQCFAVMNDTFGGLNFVMRGPVSTQTTAIGAGLVLTEFLKVRVELRHATSTTDATVRVFLNDADQPAVSKDSANANFPGVGPGANALISIGVGSGSAVNYVHLNQWSFWRGPDTTVGM